MLTYQEKKVLAVLLAMASDQFSNHGCNDFDLKAVLPQQADRMMFAKRIAAIDGELECYTQDVEMGSDFSYDNDAGLFGYFAAQLTHEVSQTRMALYKVLVRGTQSTFEEEKKDALFEIAMTLGYQEEKNAWHQEIAKPVDAEDQLGLLLYEGLRTRDACQPYLDQIAQYEELTLPQ